MSFLSHSRSSIDLNYASALRSLVFIILSASLWTAFCYRKKRQGGSSLSQLPGPKMKSWLKGNHMQIFNLKHGWEFHKMLAEQCRFPLYIRFEDAIKAFIDGPAVLVKGLLGRKQLYTFDHKILYHVLVKDGSSFEPLQVGSGAVLFGPGLTNAVGTHHRKQRKMLNPVFSIAHMRSMLPIFYDVVDQIDLLGWMARTALELIGQSGFGYSFDNMVEDVPKHKYSIVMKELQPTLTRLGFGRIYILPLAIKLLPTNVRTFIMNITPWKTLHDARDMINYMHNLSVSIYEEKKRALEAGDEAVTRQIGQGKDLMSILMRENMKADDEDKLKESELIAQVCTFIFAAMETTSTAMARILHLLALHPDVQDKLRQEITSARKEFEGGRLSYDVLVALPFLDAVCRETLRLYPAAPTILRRSTEDVVVPISRPVRGKDGTEITEVFLPKSTPVVISLLNANRSPELWGPDVLEWKPERWLSPLPDSVTDSKSPGVYSHLMTFSGGSRSCIGFKFSQLEMKAVISMLMENFKFSLPPNKKILWQMAAVASPVVAEGNGYPELPLIVESVNCV
ncbi:cytochrome P450 [Gymnopus androsaceus JB14]|uniref:Cytochrome P450 n=1 Tax=Gymnopus androsaceus JB14 TaxID=1447944 RepID=A0A6A4HUX1_9AGAR|nr:cytochrome P450 [Gymnopus androsaceus JB14]